MLPDTVDNEDTDLHRFNVVEIVRLRQERLCSNPGPPQLVTGYGIRHFRLTCNLKPSARNQLMKGPYERLKYDGRRIWECPVCNHRDRISGNVTAHMCSCQLKVERKERVCMKLVEDGVKRVLWTTPTVDDEPGTT